MKEKGQSQLLSLGKDSFWKIESIKRIVGIHMQNVREKMSFYLTAAAYLLFNLRLAPNIMETLQSTLWQIAQTSPYVAGITWFIVAVLQYMSDGEKVPWDRRFRLFFTIGIILGLVFAIIEYTGQKTGQ